MPELEGSPPPPLAPEAGAEQAGSPSPIRSMRLAIATLAGVGYIPFASGTFGTLATVPVVLLLAWVGSPALYIGATLTLTAVSIWACSACESAFGRKDPGQAVADEMSGFLFAMAFIPLTPASLACGFLLFRLTDIIKPFPARQLERLPSGWGIVADDVAAGVWANLLLRAGIAAFPGLGR